ncbi:uncharacterized protein A1O5_06674 [Cladophialophora psammophila CBS 110553]|uniref:RING-type domain-containing protein n=1 Tax=Cladophialophora psammophila CBS 110553 TaxID=1182543 RepID=W9XJR2_9EURO|nr:uncharacterized protein A1O5_06674 [Cladophialophora psammophila CBS 110553]EXJ70604.1 hypothetical protein A1O5_06674 [Cladophialophora psammophila CBS 110553]
MASQSSSPVLVQTHPPPPHTLTSAYSPEPEPDRQPPMSTMPGPEPLEPPSSSSPQPQREPAPSSPEVADAEMADAPFTEPESRPQESTNTTEEEPQVQQPDDVVVQEPATPAEEGTSTVVAEVPSQDSSSTPPPPPEPRLHIPEWTLFEDDWSKPSEEEMEELRMRESRGTELSALDIPSVEKRIYSDTDDPDMRPIKKLRLSWVIKGVRGTKDKPNHARVMVSPPALVDGNYWQIKFYPRGHTSASYSAYIKCSRRPPKADTKLADSTFCFFEGPPDADFGNGAVPALTLKIDPTAKKDDPSSTSSTTPLASQKQDSHPPSEVANPSGADIGRDEALDVQNTPEPAEDTWRLSAQLGIVMYNPDEPRTCAYASTEGQFSKYVDDWGWSSVAGPWRDVHLRQHLQRAPLLQNDTIAIDAYIRIFDDPTKALWWRSSEGEPHWDSKSLAGYFPMGTPPLYHSPAVAGMTAWLLLAPFRKLLQNVDAGGWRRNSQIRPRPFIAYLQMILFLMRTSRKERETYVDLYPAIQAMRDFGEEYTDVKTFWEAFRRSIELELDNDQESLRALKAIFDSPSGPISLPPLPVENVLDIQQALTRVLRESKFKACLPNFLPLMLARDKFDKKTREWKLLYDRVILNDEIDVSEFSTDTQDAKYTLYGFVVHAGVRNSGKFYTVLRPNGPNTMWLAFEDGDGNQVFSLSKKGIQAFEGLEGQALKDFNSTRTTAYMAMYIKISCLADYLPGGLEPYQLPKWLAPYLESSYQEAHGNFSEDTTDEDSEEINVEVYSDEGIVGREGLLDMYNIKVQSQHKGQFHLMSSPKKATYQEFRQRLAAKLGLEDPQMIRLFRMGYSGIGFYATAQMLNVHLLDTIGDGRATGQPLCLWMSVLSKDELQLFGEPDRTSVQVDADSLQSRSDASISDSVAHGGEEQIAAPDAEQDSVRAAVTADIERGSDGGQQPSAVAMEVNDSDTPMQLEVPPPTAEESLAANVPHGHLIDAAAHDDVVALPVNDETQQSLAPEVSTLSQTAESIFAAVIAEDSEAMDFVMNSGSVSTDHSASQSGESSQSSSPPPEKQGPVDSAYGFIQVFDVDRQTFRVQGTFFARSEERVRDFVQRRLGYGADKNFVAWRRHSTVDGTIVGPEDTFLDPRFVNGCDLVVYEPVSETRVKELEKEGKFSNPHDLSNYLRMVERQHPLHSRTTTEPVELAEFGTDYYKGPLVNGLCHGAKCVTISSTGNTYEGPLVCNIKCGKGGKMTYCNGDIYEGEWHQDERHGQGTFVEARTGNKYVGGFENGKRWGMGTTFWQVADEQADLCQICYGNEIDALFFDCGHVCACVECARQCELCPICRKTVKQVVKMFRA